MKNKTKYTLGCRLLARVISCNNTSRIRAIILPSLPGDTLAVSVGINACMREELVTDDVIRGCRRQAMR